MKAGPCLVAVLALWCCSLPEAAAVGSQNTATYIGNGRWDWTVYIEADPETLKRIDCVTYTLHRTFPDPVRRVCRQPNTKFALSSNGWGTFAIPIEISYIDGRVERLVHQLSFQGSTAPRPETLTPRNTSRLLEPGWWEWGLFIEASPQALRQVRCVEYTLPSTFARPVRLVCARDRGFMLVDRGFQSFPVRIKVLFEDGSMRELSHTVTLR